MFSSELICIQNNVLLNVESNFLSSSAQGLILQKLVPFCMFAISMNPKDFYIAVRTLVSRKLFSNPKTEWYFINTCSYK